MYVCLFEYAAESSLSDGIQRISFQFLFTCYIHKVQTYLHIHELNNKPGANEHSVQKKVLN